MTEERIDIIIKDSIDSRVATKMQAIAEAARDANVQVSYLQAQLSGLATGGFASLVRASSQGAVGMAKLATQTKKTESNLESLSAATVQADAHLSAYANEVQRLTMKYNPLYAAEMKHKNAIDEINRAHKMGAINVEQHSAAIQRQQNIYNATMASSAGQMGGIADPAVRQRRYRSINLGYQVQDIGVSLAGGQNPLLVLAQQGSQIAGIYGGQGGVVALMRDLGGILAGLATRTPQLLAVFGVFKSLQNEINKGSGIKVSFFDTFLAVFQLMGKGIKDLYNDFIEWSPIKALLDGAEGTMRYLFNLVVGTFKAMKQAISSDGLGDLLSDFEIKALEARARIAQRNGNMDMASQASIEAALLRKGKKGTADPFAVDYFAEYAGALRPLAQKNARDREDDKKKKKVDEYKKLLEDINGPLLDMQRQVPLLNKAYAEGEITLTQYNKRLQELQIGVLKLDNSLASGLTRGLIEVNKEMNNLGDLASQTIVNGFKSAEDALVQFAKTGELSVSKMIDGILEDLIRLQIRQSITMPLSNWLNTALGVATATGTPGTPAAGAPASSIRGYATGGVFGGGLRIVGENGPELEATGPSRIYNASQTRDMLGGGSSLVTNITINVQGGGGNDGAMAENIARQVAIAQEQSMAKFTRQQQKIGGMFNSSSVIS